MPNSKMTNVQTERPRIAAARLLLLFCVFLLIAFGLGYPTLNRFDPRQTPGLSDVKTYAAMITGTASPDSGHVRFRVLIPWIAKPIYRLAQGRIATWDPVMFSLLVTDSLFVAGTAVLIVLVGNKLLGTVFVGNVLPGMSAPRTRPSSTYNYAVALVAALLYLLNFAVPNLRLVGLVDAGEGYFLLALLACLAQRRLWLLPVIAVFGALTKESFVPFSIVFSAAWWFATRREPNQREHHSADNAGWMLASWALSFATLAGLHRAIAGSFANPLQFALALRHGYDYLAHVASSLYDRNLWYIFVWLLPTAIPNLSRFPRSLRVATGATCVVAVVLDAYYGGAPGTIGRALFSIAGPLLGMSSAVLLVPKNSEQLRANS